MHPRLHSLSHNCFLRNYKAPDSSCYRSYVTMADPSSNSTGVVPTNPFAPAESADQIFAEHGWLQGAFLSAVAYGAEVVLFFMCFYLLAKQTNKSNYKLQIPLLVYISTIFLLGTFFMGALAQFTQLAFVDNRSYPGGPAQYEADMFSIPVDELGNVAFVVSNWLCDALILWRFIVIYRGCRFPLQVVALLPCLLYLGSFTMGLLWLLQISTTNPFQSSTINWTVPYFALSLSVNILLTLAIVARLLLHRRRITRVLGQSHGTHYTSIAAMVVESAAISSTFSILFLVPFGLATPTAASLSSVFLQSMGQVQIIATLLILVRVASGKAWSSNTETILTSRNRKQRSVSDGAHSIPLSHIKLESQGSGALTANQTNNGNGIVISKSVFSDDVQSSLEKRTEEV